MLLGGMATLAATTCGAYGSPSCHDDRDCARSMWSVCNLEAAYCVTPCSGDEQCTGSWGRCDPVRHYCKPAPDAGSPQNPDSGR
jgi:hypothetical protein